MEEPNTIPPRPCSTPHSAPVGWLKPPSGGQEGSHSDEPLAEGDGNQPEIITVTRRDGWTPFARRLFLEVLAETGRVNLACEYAGLTKQSAYALRARDPVFAGGWDAACELARQPLADALYEKAIEGVTDTITREGKIVAERHRFDSRLSIAVLHRLDKRCDRAAEVGSRHLALMAHWGEWLALVGKGAESEAAALLEPPAMGGAEAARDGQLGQLPESGSPTAGVDEDESLDLSDRCWWDGFDECWKTDFPPPAGFDGWQSRDYDELDEDEPYVRVCTEEEAAILEADRAADRTAERAEEEQLRDAWFALLREEAGSPFPARER